MRTPEQWADYWHEQCLASGQREDRWRWRSLVAWQVAIFGWSAWLGTVGMLVALWLLGWN